MIAHMPLSARSRPTCGPTNSVRITRPGLSGYASASVTWRAVRSLMSDCSAPLACPVSGRSLMSRSLPEPKVCTWAPSSPAYSRRARTSSTSTGRSKRISETMPPVKSRAKLNGAPSRTVLRAIAPSDTRTSSTDTRMETPPIRMNGMRLPYGNTLNGFMMLGSRSDRDGLELAAAAVDQGGNAARGGDRGVRGHGDAHDQRHREALDRPGTEGEQRHAGQDGGDVGVHDRARCAVVPCGDRRLGR